MSSITIDYRDRRPIYEQLVGGIRELILKGIMQPGEFMPSVRSLAAELGINPNTIQKAYAELERQNIIYTVPGKGSVVGEDTSLLSLAERRSVLADIGKNASRAAELGIEKAVVLSTVENAMEGDTANDRN